jgi:FlaA1/EpsC-like NDP-sugar epimerase
VHAAALKQVPALEYNPLEAIKTNILGTQNVIDAALDNNVKNVFFISSDKAVHPINLYGATKLCAERLFISANAYRGENRKTKFSVARYGNVLGSRGSLVELLKQQRSSGIVTLTDARMTRFWITIDRVMNIILESIARMQGGEIFVPKMNSVKVCDVIGIFAPECQIKTIGIRPGEKLHEILITDHEMRRTKDLGDVFIIKPEFDWGLQDWLGNKPSPSHDFVYASNSPDLLLSKEEAGRILTV